MSTYKTARPGPSSEFWIIDNVTRQIIGIEAADGTRNFFSPMQVTAAELATLQSAGVPVDKTLQYQLDGGAIYGWNGTAIVAQGSGSGTTGKSNGIASLKYSVANAFFTSGNTIAGVIPVSGPYGGVRFVFENFDIANPLTLIAKCAPTPVLNQNGNGLTMTRITFDKMIDGATGAVTSLNGANTVTLPAAGSYTSPNAVTGTAKVSPSLVVSDIIPIQSVARSDDPATFGSDILIYLRTYSVQTLYVQSITPSNLPLNGTGLFAASGQAGTDQVTGVANIGVSVDQSTAKSLPCSSVDIFTAGKTCMIAAIGDSYDAGGGDGGGGDTNQNASWVNRMISNFRTASSPLRVAMWAVGGEEREVTSYKLQLQQALNKPDILISNSASVNSFLTTQAQQDLQFQAVLRDNAWCRANGIKHVVMLIWGSSAGIMALNARIKAFATGNNITILDANSALSLSGTGGAVNPIYMQSGLNHANVVGASRLADIFAPIILALASA